MAPTLYRGTRPGAEGRARDWAEIQERMLVPLYEIVYDRLEVGAYTRILGLGCGTGLALLLGARRGAAVTGCDTDESRLAVARDRLLPDPAWGARATGRPAGRGTGGDRGADTRGNACGDTGTGRVARPARLLSGGPRDNALGDEFDVITAFDPATPSTELRPALAAVAAAASPGATVVLAGWGPPERCATSRVLRMAARMAEPRGPGLRDVRLSGRDDLEDLARGAGLRPDGSGRVSCPFGYPDLPSAVRGLLSTGVFDAAVEATDREQVDKEITEALHPYRRRDGTIRMDNVFRYLIARV
ncbi:class I SAM-dependent methyltransferase [Streptomyces polygonati]|uniref:Class I SAM-dependent methyltransferase n=1 Tax=Streptomyces polygonati TaxID=1617087 RepID=A0ABV8HK49_9ACTN